MKGTIISLFVIIIFNIGFKAQLDPVKFKLEKTTFKYSLNSGIYKSRLSEPLLKKIASRIFLFLPKFIFHLKDHWMSQKISTNQKVIPHIMNVYSLLAQWQFFTLLEKVEMLLEWDKKCHLK